MKNSFPTSSIGSNLPTNNEETLTFGSPEETMAFGVWLGKRLPIHSILCLEGELAAGKTTLMKGLALGAANVNPEAVNSPTFVYLNIYEGSKTIYHFDLYRLHDAEEFLGMGFEEMLFSGGICCIEWAERIEELLPSHSIRIKLQHGEEGIRYLKISPPLLGMNKWQSSQ